MISYISLFVGLLSAIVGAFLVPHIEDENGKKRLSKWAFLFVLIPIISFSIAAIGLYDSQKEAKKLSNKIEASIDRVDAFEVQITYSFSLLKAGFSEDILPLMKNVMSIYSVITKNDDGSSRYGIAKNMYGGENTDSEDQLLKLIDKNIQAIRSFSPPILYAA